MTSESTEELAAVEAALEAGGATQVGIIVGAESDLEVMGKAGEVLDERGITWEIGVMSAHREPESVVAYCSGARARGIKVIIAGAGLSAALPGVAAA
ncbi:MAG: AIR carboxylase family protein, partial [Solirubrobacterales bacterium]